MRNQLELAVEERAVAGKQVKRLRERGIVPANLYGHHQPSVSLQVSGIALHKLLAQGGNNIVLLLKVENQPAVQALIKQVQHNPVSGETSHVDFYRVAATEKLKTSVQLRFVNEVGAVSAGGVAVSRPLGEVMVECLPADLPSTIQVDLARLTEMGAVIRVGDLTVGPGVTILTDHNELVAGVHAQEKAVTTDEKAEASAAAPETPEGGAAGRP